MNSFEMDMKRAILSFGFAAGVILQTVILFVQGPASDLFRMSVPVLCTLPYSTAWLLDEQSHYLKLYLARTSKTEYIAGKALSCIISGGGVLTLSGVIYLWMSQDDKMAPFDLKLFFVSGMFWAMLSATLAAWSNSRYIAYGGGFVIYYLMVILHERYFEKLYCLYPFEWIAPEHVWIFGANGIVLLVGGLTFILICLYAWKLWRCMEWL